MGQNEEMKKFFAALPVPTLPADSIILPGLILQVRRYLEEHGCMVVGEKGAVRVTYPAGTTRTEVLPRTMYERYLIVLPDGTELQEARPFLVDGDNCLWVPREALREKRRGKADS